jgi:lipoprotein-releasing system permease protein
MNITLELYIAWRYLITKKSDSYISIVTIFSLVGIAIGVASLIVVMSVMNGFRAELINKITKFEGDIAIIAPNNRIDNYEQIVEEVIKFPEILMALPLVNVQALISTNDSTTIGIQAKAMQLGDIMKKNIISENIISGKLDELEHDSNLIIGSGLANTLHIGVGDKIKIIAPQTNSSILGVIPRFKTFSIIAIFNSGMSDYDMSTIFMSLENGQQLFNMGKSVNIIEIHSKDPQRSLDTKFKILNSLSYNILINDWQTRNYAFFEALKTEKVVMFVILGLIILVAALNIISSLIMMVKDKNKDIAILRTMGLRRGSIIRIFIIYGTVSGVIGTIIGVIFGTSFALNIEEIKIFLESYTHNTLFNPVVYYLSELPSQVKVENILAISALSLSLSFLATIYPAWRATKIDPVIILRS